MLFTGILKEKLNKIFLHGNSKEKKMMAQTLRDTPISFHLIASKISPFLKQIRPLSCLLIRGHFLICANFDSKRSGLLILQIYHNLSSSSSFNVLNNVI